MNKARRQFLQRTAGAVSLGLAGVPSLGGLSAFAGEPPPKKVPFGPDIEPIVRLIEETPRERCVDVFVDQLRGGLPYRRFLAAVFFACVRRAYSHHEVYKIHAVHQVSMDVRPEERLLPLFWAINAFKQRQEDFPGDPLRVLNGSLPKPDQAAAELTEAAERYDQERAERAIVALARNQGARQTMEQLWLYGCRNGGAGGHGAISVSNCFRALEIIGWQEAEPGLRFVVQDLFHFGWLKPDESLRPNTALAEQILNKLPAGWAGSQSDRPATCDLHALIRNGKPTEACDLAAKQLQSGVAAQAIWDAVHLATAELMVRHSSGWGLASRPLHSNTSTNALHYAFRTSSSPRTRLLVLLQAVAWAASKTGGDLAGKGLRDMSITELGGVALAASSEKTVAEIFELVPPRTYRWDPKAGAVLTYGKREDADEACRKVFALTSERPDAVAPFVQTARSWLCRKASNDHHEYKFLAAILEDAALVSTEWQPHVLAASVHYFHGNQTPDNPVIEQARDALRRKT
ncbi:MAG TPA: hypothetical protein VKE94_09750 [Gemmataceae bacterium]|nr:hypothetical protein [Gemmataceae bacterium]